MKVEYDRETVGRVAGRFGGSVIQRLSAPRYERRDGRRVALAVPSMRDHMTDEGWQIMLGLAHNGYRLCGHGLSVGTDVAEILRALDPAVVLVQDKREWDGLTAGPGFDERERFHNASTLRDRDDVFKLTVLKDAQQRPKYHAESAEEIGCHAWVTYYATPIVAALAPYVRPQHAVRTYHTLDPASVPDYSPRGRSGCLLSGAVSSAYPLRQRLMREEKHLPETDVLRHPGYHRNGCNTPEYLKLLARYKVAICTASHYGYALRKIIEATACGCAVITNLPSDEYLPEIDGNLVRVNSNATAKDVGQVVRRCLDGYDPQRQEMFAKLALGRYDYRVETARLVAAIEKLRECYP